MPVLAQVQAPEDAIVAWQHDPRVIGGLLLVAVVYTVGWRRLRARGDDHFGAAQIGAFYATLLLIGLDLLSPIDSMADYLSSVHMAQHMLLIFVAPVFAWWSRPLLPLWHGLPRFARSILDRVASRLPVEAFFIWLTRPVTAWLLFVVIIWGWHLPVFYDLALEREPIHDMEHACIFYVSLLFWYPVMRPYPARPAWSRWVLIPYLILADVQFTVFSAILTFSDHVIYPYYVQVPRPWPISPLADQQIAGLIMWIPGSVIFLVPLVQIGSQLLRGQAPVGDTRG
jgi:putative membrane protein